MGMLGYRLFDGPEPLDALEIFCVGLEEGDNPVAAIRAAFDLASTADADMAIYAIAQAYEVVPDAAWEDITDIFINQSNHLPEWPENLRAQRGRVVADWYARMTGTKPPFTMADIPFCAVYVDVPSVVLVEH